MTTTTPARRPRKAARPIDRPIRTRAEFRNAQAELDAIVDSDPKEGIPAFDRMELLAILVAAYEAETLPEFVAPTPQEMVQHMAEAQGIRSGELAQIMGGRSRLSDFYNAKRQLSMPQIVKLRDLLGISADLLISRPARDRLRAYDRAAG